MPTLTKAGTQSHTAPGEVGVNAHIGHTQWLRVGTDWGHQDLSHHRDMTGKKKSSKMASLGVGEVRNQNSLGRSPGKEGILACQEAAHLEGGRCGTGVTQSSRSTTMAPTPPQDPALNATQARDALQLPRLGHVRLELGTWALPASSGSSCLPAGQGQGQDTGEGSGRWDSLGASPFHVGPQGKCGPVIQPSSVPAAFRCSPIHLTAPPGACPLTVTGTVWLQSRWAG